MVIRTDDSGVLVDLAVNAPPDLPASATPAGPTLAPEELAGNKLLALVDRAAARDFADIYILARRFGKQVLLDRAAQIDTGSAGSPLIQRTADQTLQAHFWHPIGCRPSPGGGPGYLPRHRPPGRRGQYPHQ
jgi:Nucleotidyl transferase AbiEii toxin, Type IV TA system